LTVIFVKMKAERQMSK